MNRKVILTLIAVLAAGGLLNGQTLPSVQVTVNPTGQEGTLVSSLKIVFTLLLLTLLPAIMMMMTSFTRLIISFHFLRVAMGVRTVPPNQVVVGICLFLTLFIMSPVIGQINKVAYQPLVKGEINEMEALKKSTVPLKNFMLSQTREKDLRLFYSVSKIEKPQTREDVSMLVLIPSFILSELKTAFQIGFILYIPFLIIDVIIASILVSLGMIFLPPIIVSLPFKVVLFILADGWYLITSSLLKSFQMGGL